MEPEWNISSTEEFKASTISFTSPEAESSIAYFEMSSATKEVATLRRGILNSFDMELKMFVETPAEPNSTGPMGIVKQGGC